jgi:hypothetical protein
VGKPPACTGMLCYTTGGYVQGGSKAPRYYLPCFASLQAKLSSSPMITQPEVWDQPMGCHSHFGLPVRMYKLFGGPNQQH